METIVNSPEDLTSLKTSQVKRINSTRLKGRKKKEKKKKDLKIYAHPSAALEWPS